MKLNKGDLLHSLLDHQGKLNSVLHDLKNSFDKLKSKFDKLEADLNKSRNINSKLLDRLTIIERKRFANE